MTPEKTPESCDFLREMEEKNRLSPQFGNSRLNA
jgi:hypothetical protein